MLVTPLQEELGVLTEGNDSPFSHLPAQCLWKPRRQAGATARMAFFSSFHSVGAASAERPLRMCAGCSLGPTTVRAKPLLGPGVLSTEMQPPGFNRKEGELCGLGVLGWMSDVFIILRSDEHSCHIEPKARPGYAKNSELGLCTGLSKEILLVDDKPRGSQRFVGMA